MAGCGKVCDQQACLNRSVIIVRRADGQPPNLAVDGEYDGKHFSCGGPSSDTTEISCQPDLTVYVRPTGKCQDESPGTATTTSCQPTDRFEEVIAISGTPREVHLRLKSDTALLAERTFAPSLTTSEPNGPGCGTCTQSQDVWNLP